jgi:hypothetical protein
MMTPSTSDVAVRASRRPSIVERVFTLPLAWFSLVAWAVLILAGRRIAESDIWYHLRNARELVSQRAVPRADLYTFTSAGAPLVDYEWLSELVYYAAYDLWAQRGLLVVYATLLVLTYGGVYWLACRRGAHHVSAATVTTIGVALGSYSFGPRMMHFGWLCLVGVLIILERFDRHPRVLWFLPPLFALWINLHGSWVFGFVVIGASILGGMAQRDWGLIIATRWSRKQLRQLLVASGAAGIALFANPYGYQLVWYPFDLLLRQRPAVSVIVEWASVDFHTGYGKLALLMILGLLSLAWLSRARWKLPEVLLVVFALWASLTHLRFLGFAAIILVPIVAPRIRLLPSTDPQQNKPLLNLALVVAMCGAIVRSFPSESTLQAVIDREFPRTALTFMQERHLTGRLFHPYDFGGFIEWQAPSLKTFADGRTDIFVYNEVLADFLKITTIENSFELLDKYRIDYVLYTPGSSLSYVLDHSQTWRPLYVDATAKLFERVPPADGTLRGHLR